MEIWKVLKAWEYFSKLVLEKNKTEKIETFNCRAKVKVMFKTIMRGFFYSCLPTDFTSF